MRRHTVSRICNAQVHKMAWYRYQMLSEWALSDWKKITKTLTQQFWPTLINFSFLMSGCTKTFAYFPFISFPSSQC